ncbi:MAG: hypothetical protein JW982_15605 [Spirochaetes bacterium]|nr:hypothetical protein [Spirochaetota bacterium]
MKKTAIILAGILMLTAGVLFLTNSGILEQKVIADTLTEPIKAAVITESEPAVTYSYPQFYRGLYLAYWSAKDPVRFKKFLSDAKGAHINTFVVDVQPSKNGECNIPAEHVSEMISNGIHPIARIVCFDQGLRTFPVPESKINFLYTLAENSAKAGFKEIQFDYIRFEDSSALKKMTLEEKYTFIRSFLNGARKHLEKYDVKIAADIFGRIPLNDRDLIGQKMEVLDEVTDVICPMAYPSHYTWSPKYYNDPYYAVHITSKRARERTKNAKIVSWIQAFEIKIPKSMGYTKYLTEQIQACHDAEITGYLFWNARQIYTEPLRVMKNYYSTRDLNTGKNLK